MPGDFRPLYVSTMINPELEIRPNTYYTLDETAALLRVSRRSILALLESGAALGVKIGRHWRILGRDLLQLPQRDEWSEPELRRSLMRLSEPAFARAWDNDEDSVYDGL